MIHFSHTCLPPGAGDGKLGLLIAQVLACARPGQVTLFGRHESKMSLVQGMSARVVVSPAVVQQYSGKFDLAVEASGGRAAACVRADQGMRAQLDAVAVRPIHSAIMLLLHF